MRACCYSVYIHTYDIHICIIFMCVSTIYMFNVFVLLPMAQVHQTAAVCIYEAEKENNVLSQLAYIPIVRSAYLRWLQEQTDRFKLYSGVKCHLFITVQFRLLDFSGRMVYGNILYTFYSRRNFTIAFQSRFYLSLLRCSRSLYEHTQTNQSSQIISLFA